MPQDKKFRVIEVVPGIRDESAGPSYSVLSLSRALAELNTNVELHVLDAPPLANESFRLFTYPKDRFWPAAFGSSAQMRQGLIRAAAGAQIIHSHSLWMAPNIYTYTAGKSGGCKLVVSPRGTLSDWALSHSKWKKKMVWHLLGQKSALFHADLLMATSENEYQEIRRVGLRQPVAIIQNGIDIPASIPKKKSTRKLLFLSRIHRKKGIDLLLKGWRKVQDRFPDWQLIVAGPLDSPYATEVQSLAGELQCRDCFFPGEVRGEEKWRLLEDSECLILPTFSENFGMVVAEALAHGTAVACSKNAPWEGVPIHKAGWWFELEDESICRCLEEIMSQTSEQLTALGQNGHAWMKEEFSWNEVARKTLAAYQWLVAHENKPDFVIEK
jgi:Glycosyltransferase